MCNKLIVNKELENCLGKKRKIDLKKENSDEKTVEKVSKRISERIKNKNLKEDRRQLKLRDTSRKITNYFKSSKLCDNSKIMKKASKFKVTY